ncbi:MAG: polysaccharide deacetylase family protein [Oscillospiraceae bacterium]|nr:polysaccharide deacetylase family protein [Oscillospiraceae bacterium]
MRYPFLRFPGFRLKAVTLSYDDGVVYDRKLIEIMSAHRLKGTFNISSSMLASQTNGRMLTADEAALLYTSSGNEVAAHGHRHLSLGEIDTAMAVSDVLTGRINLEKLLGIPVKGMAYANGSFNDSVIQILEKCGIVYARCSVSTEKFDLPNDWLKMPVTCHHGNPHLMELAKQFIEAPQGPHYWYHTPQWFYMYGHSYEFNDNNNWHIIEEFAYYIGNRENVWYATTMEIYNYVKAYEALQFAADGSFVYNPNRQDMYISYYGHEFLIPSGKVVLLQ